MVAFPWDIKITLYSPSANAGEYGFMLSSPEGQSKQLTIDEVGGPGAERISTEDTASHQDFAPDKDTPFSQGDFTGGIGQLEFDYKDETKYWWGSGIVTHSDGQAYLAPPVAATLTLTSATAGVAGFYTYMVSSSNTRYDFCWAGIYLYRRITTDSTTGWVLVYTEPNSKPITDFLVFNGIGVIYVPTETDANACDFWTVSDLTAADFATVDTARAHTPYSDALGRPSLGAVVRGTLFTAVGSQKIFYTVDPTVDGAAGPILATVTSTTPVLTSTAPEVGDSTYAFTKLFAANDYLYAFKQNAGYSIDSQQNVNEVFWQWRDKPSEENFKFVTSGGDLLFYSVGPEVYAYDPGTGANPSLKLSKQSGYSVQKILGLGADNQYLYVLAQVRVPNLRSSLSVVILRGAKLSGSRFSFEVLWEDTAVTEVYNRLSVVPNGVGSRLYWGYTLAGATYTNVMDIPADWNESTGTSFTTSGALYTSITRAAFPGLSKRHLWITLQTDSVTAYSGTHKIALAYSTDNGLSFTALGDTGTASLGTLLTKLDYSNVSSRGIVLRFTFTSAGTTTPVLRVFDHHQRVRFKYLPSLSAAVRVADYVENNAGKQSRWKATDLKTHLYNMRSEEGRMLYEDFLGNSFNVSLDKMTYRPTRHERPGIVVGGSEMEAMLLFNRADSGA